MDFSKVTNIIISWLKKEVEISRGKGAIFGLSGGIDSAVVAVLCQKTFGDNCLALIMPCHSNPQDKLDALEVVKTFEIPYQEVMLDEVFDVMVRSIHGSPAPIFNKTPANINLKPRLRMCVLYYIAAQRSYRVIGTNNKSESYIGYSTKYGDSAADLEPIGELLKSEVKQLAEYLGIPPKIITKKPGAGLWEGQTDEEEIGLTYSQLDHYIRTGQADPKIEQHVDEMHQQSEHKRKMPPTCPIELNNNI